MYLIYYPSLFVFLVNHIGHVANATTHDLTKFALELDNKLIWFGELPLPITIVIVKDLFHL